MRALIIEDELASSRKLERILHEYSFEILESLTSVKSTIEWFKNNCEPDIIFLDIHLEDGLCFEIFDHIAINCLIIFTTAYSGYSLKAFDYKSVSYLMKPIKREQLDLAIKKASELYYTEQDLNELRALVTENNLTVYKQRFTVKLGNRLKFINTSDICFFYSENNSTYIQTKRLAYPIGLSLTQVEEEVSPTLFFRINRKLIVCKKDIKQIKPFKNNRLSITVNDNDIEMIVSREKVKTFKDWINSY